VFGDYGAQTGRRRLKNLGRSSIFHRLHLGGQSVSTAAHNFAQDGSVFDNVFGAPHINVCKPLMQKNLKTLQGHDSALRDSSSYRTGKKNELAKSPFEKHSTSD
jgi:hypothetical protein